MIMTRAIHRTKTERRRVRRSGHSVDMTPLDEELSMDEDDGLLMEQINVQTEGCRGEAMAPTTMQIKDSCREPMAQKTHYTMEEHP